MEDEKIEQIATTPALVLAVLIFGAAVLYSSVGHAGAPGYLAVMALFGLAPEVMKPTALTLNIAVALITTVRSYRAGHFLVVALLALHGVFRSAGVHWWRR